MIGTTFYAGMNQTITQSLTTLSEYEGSGSVGAHQARKSETLGFWIFPDHGR
jgi:hypothetical protein